MGDYAGAAGNHPIYDRNGNLIDPKTGKVIKLEDGFTNNAIKPSEEQALNERMRKRRAEAAARKAALRALNSGP